MTINPVLVEGATESELPMNTEQTETSEPFTLDASAMGSHRVGDLNVAPADFLLAFGPANSEGDGYKTDREWCFKSRDGSELSIYAYKATNLYSKGDPTPDEFWAGTTPYSLSVGGDDDKVGAAFIKFAMAKIAAAKG